MPRGCRRKDSGRAVYVREMIDGASLWGKTVVANGDPNPPNMIAYPWHDNGIFELCHALSLLATPSMQAYLRSSWWLEKLHQSKGRRYCEVMIKTNKTDTGSCWKLVYLLEGNLGFWESLLGLSRSHLPEGIKQVGHIMCCNGKWSYWRQSL